jgi:predicted RNase H-like nuclease (RuvC/YqgF family)
MRGKHGASAQTRHKIQTAEASIESYQHAVRKLTAENKDLKQQLHDQRIAHAQETKRLKAERDEGISPALAVAQRENATLRERVNVAEMKYRHIRKLWDRVREKIQIHFEDVHGELPVESLETFMRLIAPPGEDFVRDDGRIAMVAPPGDGELELVHDQTHRHAWEHHIELERARGARRP